MPIPAIPSSVVYLDATIRAGEAVFRDGYRSFSRLEIQVIVIKNYVANLRQL